jgi:hypothetical protein
MHSAFYTPQDFAVTSIRFAKYFALQHHKLFCLRRLTRYLALARAQPALVRVVSDIAVLTGARQRVIRRKNLENYRGEIECAGLQLLLRLRESSAS